MFSKTAPQVLRPFLQFGVSFASRALELAMKVLGILVLMTGCKLTQSATVAIKIDAVPHSRQRVRYATICGDQFLHLSYLLAAGEVS